ncbi:cation:proton antiporter [Pseudomonas donghuensis]|uniref:cation:proton antiporter n=1 Tax=Pseudomonas donghuensis TaxID=1163398 RepID=UPI00215DF083|nr:cation:proton antiporter [Pseudomonas donghuensis]UVL26611.1 cation:proton antiporter [Pseudomonas donghuensis]
MSIALWSLLLGTLLITMVLGATLLARLLLSSAMVYLLVGYMLGPAVFAVITLDPAHHADVLEWVAEVAVLISLFNVGLKMGAVPFSDRSWRLPLRLALISMVLTVGLITAVGFWGLGLPLGAAVLLGGILAPTDPVLASGVQTNSEVHPDRLRFSLSGEGGLNDGTAFPFVILGLGLLGLHDLGRGGWRWWAIDLIWATAGGLLIGVTLGAIIGSLVVHLRTRYRLAVGLDEFLSLGLLAMAYGAAQLSLASGFLAVFAAGLALQRVKEQPQPDAASLSTRPGVSGHAYKALATHSHHASATMTNAVIGFNEQPEKLAELGMVLFVGALLPYVVYWPALWWFIPLLFMLLRSLAVAIGMLGEYVPKPQRMMICWFGIRGIGSIFYLMFAIRHGLPPTLAQQLITLTLVTVTVSIVVHGMSVLPLMKWYERQDQPLH